MRRPSKKLTIAVAAAGIIAVGGATALAYWTTTGSGSGTGATTAGTSNTLTFTQNVLTPMYPGDSSQNLTVAVKNTGTESAYVASVKAYVTTDKAGCTGADFLLGGVSAPSTMATAAGLSWTAADLAASGQANATSTIQFNNTAANQDVCKSAVVTINYLAS
jgi:hypothetical protein